ncbi:MAG: acyltransferase family protein [Acidimicrobiales bacterium]
MATTTIEAGASTSEPTGAHWFRGDVDGIRAIAIVLVVAYHAGLPLFGGGFIGVDVFFVISGFLISRNLLREGDSQGRISLGRFWARRVRRLVPALALVVAVTLVASYLILPLFQMVDVAKQGAAASLYVSNILFAGQASSYFGGDITASPFLHTWSLGVEEQFYLVWPVIFAVVCWVVTRRRAGGGGQGRRRMLVAVFGATLVGSLALNLVLTAHRSTWAFFGLPARAWEFAVAGLLAAIPVPRLLRRVSARTALAIAGLGLLAVAMALISDSTPYPGPWALLPVTATLLLILAGETWGGEVRATPLSSALAVPPMQWLGRVSYSWYLWHWPAIVLFVAAVDSDAIRVKSTAALATLPVAWLAYRYFETPLRFSPLVARSSARTFLAGAVVTVAVVALAVAVRPETSTAGPRSETLTAADFEAPPGSSLEERVNVTVSELRKRAESSCPKDGVKTRDGDQYCVGGDVTADRTLMLLGDSHAGQWRVALDQIAKAHHVKLLIRQHNGCPAYQADVTDPLKGDIKTTLCREAHGRDLAVIDALQPDAVVIANWSGNRDNLVDDSGDRVPEAEQAAVWETGMRSLLGELEKRSIPFGVVVDEPDLPDDPMKCLARKGTVAPCEHDRATDLAQSEPLLDVERRVLAETPEVPSLDMTPLLCDDQRCHLEIDGTLVYSDTHHLSDAFAVKEQPLLEPMVSALLP